MGFIYASLNLSNPSNPDLLPIDVKALADSGALFLCVPQHIAFQLKLPEHEKREVVLASGERRLCPYVGPVHIRFENRQCLTAALVLGNEVLLGVLPCEDMDLRLDPRSRRVIVNPESPNIPVALTK